MSVARAEFLENLKGLTDAVGLDPVSGGATNSTIPPGVLILRRGILIAALISLETFTRDRTTELLGRLGGWPASFADLPQELRDAALFDGITNLHRYAKMLQRQGEDYETELIAEIKKMASNTGPAFQFTRFIAGDYTGNISENSLRSLLSYFQVSDCWTTFQRFSSDIGLGVPSVLELVREVVRKRHRSAHAAGFSPTPSDIVGLPSKLFVIGACFDAAMTTSVEQALAHWNDWSSGNCSWRSAVDIYFVDDVGGRFRLTRPSANRAIKRFDRIDDALRYVPRSPPGRSAVVVYKDASGTPISWSIA